MKQSISRLASRLPDDSAGRAINFALLAAALAGLYLLLEIVVSLVADGPQDPLAVISSPAETFGVPTGGRLIGLLVLAVAIVLAGAVLTLGLNRPLRRSSFRPSRPLALGSLAAAGLILLGAYLSFSGALAGSIPYGQHVVRRGDLDPGSLAVLAAFFLSVTIAGLLNWRLLAATLLAWLVAGFVFGFPDTESLDGLLLFPRAELQDVSGEFAEAVSGARPDGLETGQTAGTDEPLLSAVTAFQRPPPEDSPVFRVSGAANTRYLRTATGDSYVQGNWSQVDQAALELEENQPVFRALAVLGDQLHLPTAAPLHEFTNRIEVAPVDDEGTLPAGPLPAAKGLQSVDIAATYFPFSETLDSGADPDRYAMESELAVFALGQKVAAAAAAVDPVHLQLPQELPTRVHGLVEQFDDHASPYIRTRLIQAYLQDQYDFESADSDQEVRPPPGQDPVDWFLFERGVGTSSNFSSAFVVLARAAGIPARAVSGWVVATQEAPQTVRQSQAHQWAEVALDGLGWMTVDPFPRDAFSDAEVHHGWTAALEELSLSASPAVRRAVPPVWGDDGDSDALRGLFAAVAEISDPVAGEAARSILGALALDRITGMLLSDEDAGLRGAAAFGLEVLADPAAQDALSQALAADEDASVRAAAALAMGAAGADGAAGDLLRALAADREPDVRAAAARALAALQSAGTAGGLLAALGSDSAEQVRAEAALALGQIRVADSLLPLIEAREGDAAPTVQAAAAESLTRWGFAELLEIFDFGDEVALRAAAVQLLGEGKFEEAIAPLGGALRDSNEQIRDSAQTALERFGKVTWLESGGGVLSYQGDLALLPRVTSESNEVGLPTPVFRVRGSADTRLLRVAVGDFYRDGEWFPEEQVGLPAGVEGIGFRPSDIRPAQAPDAGAFNRIALSGFGFSQLILSGPVPTSLHAQSFSVPVSYRVPGHTVWAQSPPALFDWDAFVYDYTPEQLRAARAWTVSEGSAYLQLPEGDWIEQARALASAITAGQVTAYGKAKAIEEYLAAEFRYGPESAPDSRRDPVREFLFATREGGSGQFSSAFAILARAVGIPARVVSGWAVSDIESSQVVFTDQAHQWAEVPFEGLGWVTFDPAPVGAPARTPRDELESYERLGATVTRLESGAGLVELDGELLLTAATTARRALEPPDSPLFEIAGAANTGYLRTGVGDLYEGGEWARTDPGSIRYAAGDDVGEAIRRLHASLGESGSSVVGGGPGAFALLGIRPAAIRNAVDRIRIFPASGREELPRGAVPTSLDLQWKERDGTLQPYGATFSSETGANEYEWSSSVSFFSRAQYDAAEAISGSGAYTQLPGGLPIHIRQLAEQITRGHGTPYAKAVALERYLAINYDYAFADDARETGPPAGRDPVDWFLFDSRVGTSGQFSSAFAVLARAVGIPARVVGGFAISPTLERQAVMADQAHQWAEIALDGVGWVRFDPTAAEGAPSRTSGAAPTPRFVSDRDSSTGDVRIDTVTNITESPAEMRRIAPFLVEGEVRTSDGRAVSGMAIEIYINETKEHGGTRIGLATSRDGRFRAVAHIPPAMQLGDYQLLARAVGNSLYNESWSDPDIQVYSGNRIELAGPAEIDIGAEARFEGRVTDDSERGVNGREITVRFNGDDAFSVMTDEEGRFGFSSAFGAPGRRWVEVVLREEELLLDNTARLSFAVVVPTALAVFAPDSVALGDGFTIAGFLRAAEGSALGQAQVELTLAGAGSEQAFTVDVAEDGSFEHRVDSISAAGRHTVTGRFAGGELVRPAAAEIAVQVLAPTEISLTAPVLARDGERFRIEGVLSDAGGLGVPDVPVRIRGDEWLPLQTDAEGRFSGELTAVFSPGPAPDSNESSLRVEAAFGGTEILAASGAATSVAVGVPHIVIEPVEPVTRGDEVNLQGAVLLGRAQPLPGAEITIGPDSGLTANEAGAFSHSYRVPADAPLGDLDLAISAPAYAIEASAKLMVRSATTLIVTPVGRVNPGESATLQIAVLNDAGAGIPGATVRTDRGEAVVASSSGLATLEVDVPDLDSLRSSGVVLTYAGDDRQAPASVAYYWAGAITPEGTNWLARAGIPVLVVLLLAAAFAGRRFAAGPLLERLLRRRAPIEPTPVAVVEEPDSGPEEPPQPLGEAGEAVADPDPSPFAIEIAFEKRAEDLADVWGTGELVDITLKLSESGSAMSGAMLEASVSGEDPVRLSTGEDGECGFTWIGSEPGKYSVQAIYPGDGEAGVIATRGLHIVDFQVEIVRLYGAFLDWAKSAGVGVSELSTAREAESILASAGLSIPRQILQEIVARFEEADYSEHAISRRHYEAMFRAVRELTGTDP